MNLSKLLLQNRVLYNLQFWIIYKSNSLFCTLWQKKSITRKGFESYKFQHLLFAFLTHGRAFTKLRFLPFLFFYKFFSKFVSWLYYEALTKPHFFYKYSIYTECTFGLHLCKYKSLPNPLKRVRQRFVLAKVQNKRNASRRFCTKGAFDPYKSSICKKIDRSTSSLMKNKRDRSILDVLKSSFYNVRFWILYARSSSIKLSPSQFFTWTYFLFFLIIPICALIAKASEHSLTDFITIATQPIALSAYSVTFSMAFIASLFNAFFGFILAWVLVRYNFPGKRFLDAAIDLPFAVPTSVAGLTLATVYSPQGWIGEFLGRFGIQVIYTRLGVATAMVFVSLPFVVRSLQPVLQEIDSQIEEASWSLGASPYTTFRKVLFPPLLPAFLTGVTLGFSRAIGEYGSLVLVSSNIPYKDLIASVLIFQNLEQYSLGQATVIATVVLLISFSILLGVSSIQSWNRNKQN